MGALRHLRALTSKVYITILSLPIHRPGGPCSLPIYGVVTCSLPSPCAVSKQQVFASADKCNWKIFKFIRQIVMKVTLMASKLSLPHHYGVLFFSFCLSQLFLQLFILPSKKGYLFFPCTGHCRGISLNASGKGWCDCPAPSHVPSVAECATLIYANPIT